MLKKHLMLQPKNRSCGNTFYLSSFHIRPKEMRIALIVFFAHIATISTFPKFVGELINCNFLSILFNTYRRNNPCVPEIKYEQPNICGRS